MGEFFVLNGEFCAAYAAVRLFGCLIPAALAYPQPVLYFYAFYSACQNL